MQKLDPAAQNIKQFVLRQHIPACNCKINFDNFVLSKSVEQLYVISSNDLLVSDDMQNRSRTYYNLMCEFCGFLCALRPWLVF